MRAVFTLDLPDSHGGFPANPDIIAVVRRFGWEFQDLDTLTRDDIRAMMGTSIGGIRPLDTVRTPESSDVAQLSQASVTPASLSGVPKATTDRVVAAADDSERIRQHSRKLAEELFLDMPEVAAAEKKAVVLLGYEADEQVLFVITRMVPGQVTFRLLHRELTKLQAATEKMMLKVLDARFKSEPIRVTNPTVYVYERGFDHIILEGRVITQPLREALRGNLKDTLLFIVPLFLFLPTAFAAITYPGSPTPAGLFWQGTIERLSTVLATTSLVSLLGLVQSWLEIRRGRIIDWSFTARVRASGARGVRRTRGAKQKPAQLPAAADGATRRG